MDKAEKRLKEAADLIAQGWTQWRYTLKDKTGHTSYCALGALFATVDIMENGLEAALRRLANALPEGYLSEFPRDSIVKFNDDPNTTKEDVLLVFKKAIYDA